MSAQKAVGDFCGSFGVVIPGKVQKLIKRLVSRIAHCITHFVLQSMFPDGDITIALFIPKKETCGGIKLSY